MEISEILSKVDHTCLSLTAGAKDIEKTVDEAIAYKTAAVCVPPSFVGEAVRRSAGRSSVSRALSALLSGAGAFYRGKRPKI